MFLDSPTLVPDVDSRSRQYAGLAIVIIAYLGGIIGWSWAAFSVDSAPTPPDTTHTRVELPPGAASGSASETQAAP